MKIVSSRDTLAAIPAHMARAVRESAEAHGENVAQAIKRLLLTGLAAEGEPVARPRPMPKRVFERITTIADDAC